MKYYITFFKWLKYLPQIKKVGKIIIASLFYYTGIVLISNILNKKKKLRILMYHSIADSTFEPYDPELTVKIKYFDWQMRYIKNKYNIISLEEAMEWLYGKKDIPENSVAITFDDGYKNNYVNAFPILRKYSIPATIFLVSGNFRNDEDMLSLNEIKEMSKNSISFGAHGISHKILAELSHKEIQDEIRVSKESLEQKLAMSIAIFAYPTGNKFSYNNFVKEELTKNGFKMALTAERGVNFNDTNPLEIKRTIIATSDSRYLFVKKMQGALDILSGKFWQTIKNFFSK